jgi:GNAT superfamily N-acetyltransferase
MLAAWRVAFGAAPCFDGRGAGSTLVRLAEVEARSRGCIGSCVITLSFQAVPFYRKLGYTVFGTLADSPPGHTTIYLHKRFDTAPGRATVVARAGEPQAT